jgi:hypothetical protein
MTDIKEIEKIKLQRPMEQIITEESQLQIFINQIKK